MTTTTARRRRPFTAAATLLLGVTVLARCAQRGSTMTADSPVQTSATPPIACQPFALSAAERARSRELREAIAAVTHEARAHGEGYAFRLRPDTEVFRQAAEWITLERRCCPFLTFELQWAQGAAEPWLRVSGPAGTREFLGAEMPELPHE